MLLYINIRSLIFAIHIEYNNVKEIKNGELPAYNFID